MTNEQANQSAANMTYYQWLYGMVLQGLCANPNMLASPARLAQEAHLQVMESLPYINPPG